MYFTFVYRHSLIALASQLNPTLSLSLAIPGSASGLSTTLARLRPPTRHDKVVVVVVVVVALEKGEARRGRAMVAAVVVAMPTVYCDNPTGTVATTHCCNRKWSCKPTGVSSDHFSMLSSCGRPDKSSHPLFEVVVSKLCLTSDLLFSSGQSL